MSQVPHDHHQVIYTGRNPRQVESALSGQLLQRQRWSGSGGRKETRRKGRNSCELSNTKKQIAQKLKKFFLFITLPRKMNTERRTKMTNYWSRTRNASSIATGSVAITAPAMVMIWMTKGLAAQTIWLIEDMVKIRCHLLYTQKYGRDFIILF